MWVHVGDVAVDDVAQLQGGRGGRGKWDQADPDLRVDEREQGVRLVRVLHVVRVDADPLELAVDERVEVARPGRGVHHEAELPDVAKGQRPVEVGERVVAWCRQDEWLGVHQLRAQRHRPRPLRGPAEVPLLGDRDEAAHLVQRVGSHVRWTGMSRRT